MTKRSWGLKREWSYRRCPRCQSIDEGGDQFCWMCKWDYSKSLHICERCGMELNGDESCACRTNSTADTSSSDEDNE